jgi:hypothetical protein
MTSSQGVVKSLSSGTLSRPSLDIPTSGPPALSLKPSSESILTRGFKRNRTIKGTRGERNENGTVKTWEWKGTVCNNGIKVGGCSTGVLVLNVSPLFVTGSLSLTKGTGQDFFEFSISVRKSNGQTLEYRHAQPIDMITEMT